MKKLITSITFLLLLGGLFSCEDILDQQAVDSFNEESVFQDINLVDAYLGRCYDYIGGDNNQVLGLREDLLSSATDETLCIHRPGGYTFVKGTLSPDDMGHFGNWRFSFLQWDPLYQNIKNVNVLLANIDKTPIETPNDQALLDRMKAEAHFIRAFDYTNLFRSYGGLILIDKPFELGEDFLEAKRSGVDETLDFILADIEKAIAGLPEKGNIEQGRATKGAAAALKSRLLSFSAGELMNGGYMASDPLVSFQNGSRESRLQQAKAAAKSVMDGTYGEYALVGGTDDPPANMTQADVDAYAANFYNLFTQKGEWNDEVIWGVQYLNSQGNTTSQNKWFGPNGYHNWGNNNPLEPVVRKFEMSDGTPFQWDKYNPGDDQVREFSAAELEADPERNPYNGREPRFYASVLYDGAKWQDRPSDAAGIDPTGRVQTGYWLEADGSETAGLDTRQGLIEAWNGTKVGYYIKKYMDESTVGQYFNNENAWLEFRYAEVVLDFAEAAIELGDIQEGLDALNMVRNRAGLPDRVTADQAQAREWLRHERQIEFFGEGDRWYTIRKWMIADEVIKDVHSMKITHFSDGGTRWFYDKSTTVDEREWKDSQYWLPIAREEKNKAPQLTQNPGY
ncbi:RagB/SusD family nutrient uptake outer membrane protein [Membranicola marinus]|uniref:RagB/SusD family nutrient uptake outer membrane protein n=1 Tax=Membranihabitans marinus TaxID=1227546 RepID=A0A953LCJ1_9BACT|nr:RagB/SusD family nutrient uptake outer membrane protein [Membranihabitans marinus]MBY5959561.1 RagB/SusD family nutrient uptake outer membrane protein [Membranihabitans marinus]